MTSHVRKNVQRNAMKKDTHTREKKILFYALIKFRVLIHLYLVVYNIINYVYVLYCMKMAKFYHPTFGAFNKK